MGAGTGIRRGRQTWLGAPPARRRATGAATAAFVWSMAEPGRHRAGCAGAAAAGGSTSSSNRPRPGDNGAIANKSLCLHDPVWTRIATGWSMYTQWMEVNYLAVSPMPTRFDEEKRTGKSPWSAMAQSKCCAQDWCSHGMSARRTAQDQGQMSSGEQQPRPAPMAADCLCGRKVVVIGAEQLRARHARPCGSWARRDQHISNKISRVPIFMKTSGKWAERIKIQRS
ncbi:hypothetical protein FQR65_LT20925 [Abscondita terminalis]|nr:hypothetical protein FQR65_LT20925 [Abscondita terminalis]